MRTQNKYTLPCRKKDISSAISDTNAHFGIREHAIDFALPKGSEVLAAQDGKVVRLRESSDEGGADEKYRTSPEFNNRIVLEHKNGEFSEYGHLQHQSAKVEMGDMVEQGDVIALSGNTGYSTRPHLHFHVLHEIDDNPGWETLKIQWGDPPETEIEQKEEGRQVTHYNFGK